MLFAHSIKSAARALGIDLRRSEQAWQARLIQMLRHRGVRTILDVGANSGQYAVDLIEHGLEMRIVSFEPLPDAWAELQERTAGYTNWTTAPRMALSNKHGEANFHIAGNGLSSSLLPMADACVQAAPHTRTIGSINVPTRRLDDVVPELALEGAVFLKIDVQGAEHLVLLGAEEALRGQIVGVQLEMSLVELYEGQPSYGEIDAQLRSLGFECWDLVPEFRDPRTLRLLQYDGIYFRK